MPTRFAVLASGSRGNSSFLEVDGFGILLDIGLGPRKLGSRLAAIGANWSSVKAVLLTHTHGDHWNQRTLAHLRRERIPLYCHETHAAQLSHYSKAFNRLRREGWTRIYQDSGNCDITNGLRCRPVRIRHDSGATFGFRFDGPHWSVAYVADLGTWTPDLAGELADVDVLCLEFNHDVWMERSSGRTQQLINRVLGDEGHLSNEQAAQLLAFVLRLSTPGRLRHLVQLHLSRDCNCPSLSVRSVQAVLNGQTRTIKIHTASQDQAGPLINLDFPSMRRLEGPAHVPRWLPGWEA